MHPLSPLPLLLPSLVLPQVETLRLVIVRTMEWGSCGALRGSGSRVWRLAHGLTQTATLTATRAMTRPPTHTPPIPSLPARAGDALPLPACGACLLLGVPSLRSSHVRVRAPARCMNPSLLTMAPVFLMTCPHAGGTPLFAFKPPRSSRGTLV